MTQKILASLQFTSPNTTGIGKGGGRFLKPGHLSDKVCNVTPHRTAPSQAEPRTWASFVAEGSTLTITPDLGCAADAEGPSHATLSITMGTRLDRLLLHHQAPRKLS